MLNLTMKWALRTLCWPSGGLVMVVSCVTLVYNFLLLSCEGERSERSSGGWAAGWTFHTVSNAAWTPTVSSVSSLHREGERSYGANRGLGTSLSLCPLLFKASESKCYVMKILGFKTRKLTLGEWKWFQTVCWLPEVWFHYHQKNTDVFKPLYFY